MKKNKEKPIALYMSYRPAMIHYTGRPAWYNIVNTLESEFHLTALPEYAFKNDSNMPREALGVNIKRRIDVYGGDKDLLKSIIDRENKLIDEHFSYMNIHYSLK